MKFDEYSDRTQIYHAGLIRLFNDNRSHEVSLQTDYTFNKGLKFNLNMRYMNATEANCVDFGGSTISNVTADLDYTLADGTPYFGLVAGRRTRLRFGKVQNF